LKIWFILIVSTIYALSEDFISEFEYGQMLYKDPRGVSCASCHADLGEGAFIASFKNKDGLEIKFNGPDIRALDINSFKKAISKGGRIMPKYYLTKKEVEAIFKYIKIVNNYEKSKESKENNGTNLPEVVVDTNYTLEESNQTSSNNTLLGKIFKTKPKEQ